MIELEVIRFQSKDGATIGHLLKDGEPFCLTLEDPIREIPGQPVSAWKIPGDTAIPAGRYQVVRDFSPHFGRLMAHITGIEGFDRVLIHIGNSPKDTEGCLLIAESAGDGVLYHSLPAFNAFYDWFNPAMDNGEEVWITYKNPSE